MKAIKHHAFPASSCLSLAPPEANPDTRILACTVYLVSESNTLGSWGRDLRKGVKLMNGMLSIKQGTL